MDPIGLGQRFATSGDRSLLASFSCTSTDPRLEYWVRNDALDRALSSTETDDLRLLLFHQDDGQLVGVTAHERNYVVAGSDGDPLPGSYFIVVAIADRFRDSNAPDGQPLVSAILNATLADIRSRLRGDCVVLMVRHGNTDGESITSRLDATLLGQSGIDDVYVMFLG